MLGELAAALGAKKVNIRAFQAWVQEGRGMVRVVVDKHVAAKKEIAARGWSATEEEVLQVSLGDSPGTLGRIGSKLGKAGVNIQYAYGGPGGGARKASVYIGVTDLKAALKAAR
jgi:hypothetical protein